VRELVGQLEVLLGGDQFPAQAHEPTVPSGPDPSKGSSAQKPERSAGQLGLPQKTGSSLLANMFAVIYTWVVRPGQENAFIDAWHRATVAIAGRCDSYGSRLHRADDGSFVAYARWPSTEARAECFAAGPPDAQAAADMVQAIERMLPERQLEIVEDLLGEPTMVGPGDDPGVTLKAHLTKR
jgi:hypothetical protein